ncbi:RHS repeat protein, partial [Hafnia alvei]|uniref:RHS repeat-associated core domain-containing protein n=1 Tax=Hafnia alvei TaxID=569 RepID=UPI0010333343
PRGQLSDIVSPFASQHYEYDGAGRLIHERSALRSADYHLDLAGNRLISRYIPEAFMADMRHPGNRLSEDAHFHYQYDQYGNLSQKISKRDAGEVHHYRYDHSHRLVSYLCTRDGEALRGGRYCYDPLGRRIGKQLMQHNQPKHISWFGWDGDKLVLTERDGTRIHTVYLPHSFVPLLRFEGDKPPTIAPLADKLEQEVGITLPPEFKQTLHPIELALRANRLSEEQHAWLNQIQLSPDYLATLLDPLPDTPYTAQLYDCNHLGTPQQLINLNGHIDWSITLDAWGNTLSEENPHQLHQPIRMQGQQYDEESGLHYNRHRYYDPTIGRYITQDPIGLDGGMNVYKYPLNTVTNIDPLGLTVIFNGNEEQKKAMKDAYESVRKTKHGKEMIDKLESSNHTYIFREPRKGMEHTCYDPTEFIFYIEKDSDHTSCQSQGKDKACKMTPTPLSVVIAHEMGHAMGEKDDGPGHMNNVKKYENPVRKEMGIPDRMKY